MWWRNVHGWAIRGVVAVLHLCHDGEISPEFLAKEAFVQTEEEEKQAIRTSANVMEHIESMKLLVEDIAACGGHSLPQQQSPHEEPEVEHSQHHCSGTRSLAAATPHAVGQACEEAEQ